MSAKAGVPSVRTSGTLRRLTAFSSDPSGGNPAGVWTGAGLPGREEMQRIAAEVGYSETAFVAPVEGSRYLVRYYSPEAEVSFCGHATIATGVVLGETHGAGTYLLETAVGPVPVDVAQEGARWVASLTSVAPRQRAVPDRVRDEALRSFGWSLAQLDPSIPPRLAYAGAWHLVLAVSERATLDAMAYDFEALKAAMLEEDLTTVQVIWRESDCVVHARNPFPVGGVVEDPATGAAGAALGGYLRDVGILPAPASFLIHQGAAMGRPSELFVDVPVEGGITVTGTAVGLDEVRAVRDPEAEGRSK